MINIIAHRICPEYKSYSDAQGMCETASMNGFATGRLFEPHTQDFNDKVNVEAIDVFGWSNDAWIGINAKGGSWVYTSSGIELEFENWASNYPSSYSGDCVRFYSQKGKWINVSCNYNRYFICEFV